MQPTELLICMPLLLQLLFRRCSSAESVHRAGLEERAVAFPLWLLILIFRLCSSALLLFRL